MISPRSDCHFFTSIMVVWVVIFSTLVSLVVGAWVPVRLNVVADNGYAVYVGSSEVFLVVLLNFEEEWEWGVVTLTDILNKGVSYLGSDWVDSVSSQQIGHFPGTLQLKWNNIKYNIFSFHFLFYFLHSQSNDSQLVHLENMMLPPPNSHYIWIIMPTLFMW